MMVLELEKRILDLDFTAIKDRLINLKGQEVTLSYLTKQKRKTLNKVKGVLTMVSDNLFCISITERRAYTRELSFTFAELKTGEVQIDEIFY